jgi:hypothetical protein
MVSVASPKYRAFGDGVHDDTAAWAGAIADAISQGKWLSCPSGATYLVSRQGLTPLTFDGHSHPYALKITKTLVIAGKGCTIKVGISDSNTANVFWFDNTSHVRISGITFSGTGVAKSRTPVVNRDPMLYVGAAIVFNRCDDCWASNIQSNNMRGNTLVFQSYNSGVKDSFSSIPIGSQAGCHFCLYSSAGGLIDNVTVYGGSADGDIYALGRPLPPVTTTGNTIRNSRAYNLAFGDNSRTINVNVNRGGQAFGCDAQQSNCIIEGSYAFGYYFSFDCKGGSVGCTFANNVAERTKVGLACRPGEGPYIPPYQCTFANNKIFPEGGTGNPNSADYFGGVTSEACFFLQNAYNATVQGNTCEAVGYQPNASEADDFVGLFAVVDDTFATDSALMGGVELQNNTFIMSQTVSGSTTITSHNHAIYVLGKRQVFPRFSVLGGAIKPASSSSRRDVIHIENANNVSVLGVTIEPFGSTSGASVIALKAVTNVSVANNMAPSPGLFLKANDSANISVNGNMIGSTRGAAIYSVNSSGWTVTGNAKTQVGPGDDVFFRTWDADPCPSGSAPVLLAANNVRAVSATTAMSRICGIDDYNGAGVARSGNTLNGTPWDGLNLTKSIKGSDGSDCNLVFRGGLLESTTCP